MQAFRCRELLFSAEDGSAAASNVSACPCRDALGSVQCLRNITTLYINSSEKLGAVMCYVPAARCPCLQRGIPCSIYRA